MTSEGLSSIQTFSIQIISRIVIERQNKTIHAAVHLSLLHKWRNRWRPVIFTTAYSAVTSHFLYICALFLDLDLLMAMAVLVVVGTLILEVR